jgi:hypothetical protein
MPIADKFERNAPFGDTFCHWSLICVKWSELLADFCKRIVTSVPVRSLIFVDVWDGVWGRERKGRGCNISKHNSQIVISATYKNPSASGRHIHGQHSFRTHLHKPASREASFAHRTFAHENSMPFSRFFLYNISQPFSRFLFSLQICLCNCICLTYLTKV